MSTTAEYDPEADEYVLNGEKQWITNGQRGGVAIVFAKTDGDDERSITQFRPPPTPRGSQSARRRRSSVCAPRTRPASPSTTVGSRPKTGSLRRGRGSAALRTLTGGRIGIASQAVGLAQAAFDEAKAYAAEREQFGGPIDDIQTIQHTFAEMATDISAARLLVREACRQAEAGRGQPRRGLERRSTEPAKPRCR